jgi:thymidylate synthase/dihydrofolate reductase
MKIIAAVAKITRGIGFQGKLPWGYIKQDMDFFRECIRGKLVIMGNTSFKEMKEIPNDSSFLVLSRTCQNHKKCNVKYVTSLEEINAFLKQGQVSNEDVCIAGGEHVYNMFINDARVTEILLSEVTVEKPVKCDKFFPFIPDTYFDIEEFRYLVNTDTTKVMLLRYTRANDLVPREEPYLSLGRKILKEGSERPDRTGVGTLGIFGEKMTFDIGKTVPLLATKRVAIKACIEELLWFLRGETDATILSKKGVHIWDGNTSREFLDNMGFHDVPTGELRLGYGHQIRRCGPNRVDQLLYVENLLKTDPFSRRILWNLWNASDVPQMVLTPCHNQIQFYVTKKGENMYLSAQLYIRSSDYFLGLPFNIFSYTVLTYILAARTGMTPDKLHVVTGDTHVYLNHLEQVKEQLCRPTTTLPVLLLSKEIETKEYTEITIDDFQVIGYFPQKGIKAEMAV